VNAQMCLRLIVSTEGFTERTTASVLIQFVSIKGFTPTRCAVRSDPMCAKSGFFATSAKCFRAGLVIAKLLKRMVSAEGIESV
jgi:hypothetical protein